DGWLQVSVSVSPGWSGSAPSRRRPVFAPSASSGAPACRSGSQANATTPSVSWMHPRGNERLVSSPADAGAAASSVNKSTVTQRRTPQIVADVVSAAPCSAPRRPSPRRGRALGRRRARRLRAVRRGRRRSVRRQALRTRPRSILGGMAAEHAITTVEQLRELYPPPKERSVRKELDHLDGHCREFIALSPFLLVASAIAAGACDVSPKGGPPGFVHVLDDHRLAIPDATGNR